MPPISILLVEDSALFGSALANVLDQTKVVRSTVCSSKYFLKKGTPTKYDAVIVDAVTWATGTQELVDAVQRVARVTPVILLGREDLPGRFFEVVRAGVAGFVKQTAPPKLLTKAIKAVVAGEVWFDRKLFRKIFGEASEVKAGPQPIRLSEKEKRILDLVAEGRTNKEIGTLLGLRERTIKAHVSNLFRKVRVPNRCSLATYAILHGLTRLDPNA